MGLVGWNISTKMNVPAGQLKLIYQVASDRNVMNGGGQLSKNSGFQQEFRGLCGMLLIEKYLEPVLE